jgi:hypothetical protein
VVRDAITSRSVTRPATSEEARQAAYRVEHPLRHPAVDRPSGSMGGCPAGEVRVWLRAEDGWWDLVAGRDGVRWMRAKDLLSASVPTWYLRALSCCAGLDRDRLDRRFGVATGEPCTRLEAERRRQDGLGGIDARADG